MHTQELDGDGPIIAVATPFPTVHQMQWMIESRQRAKERGERLPKMAEELQGLWKEFVTLDRREMLVRRGQFKRVAPKVLQVWRAYVKQCKKERFAWWVGIKPLKRRCFMRLHKNAANARQARAVAQRLQAADAVRIRNKLQEKRDWIQRMNERYGLACVYAVWFRGRGEVHA